MNNIQTQPNLLQWLAHHEKALISLILALSFTVQLLLSPLPGYKIDQGSFLYWYNYASGGNFSNFYEPPNWSDYPPFNVYLFWFFGNLFLKPAALIHSLFPSSTLSLQLFTSIAVKLPAILFNTALTVLIYIFLRRRFSFRASMAAASFHAFNPAVIYDLAVWGQMDSVYSFIMALSLMLLLSRKYELSSLLLSIGILTKPQSVLLAPFLIYMLLKEKNWTRFLSCAVVSTLAILLIVLPFAKGNPLSFLLNIYGKAYSVYPYTSINAYNFWALAAGPAKFWLPDNQEILNLSLRSWGIILFMLFTSCVLWRFHKKSSESVLLFSVFLLTSGFFFFMTRMHERYIFFALPALSFTLPYLPRLGWIYAALSLTFFATLYYILPILNSDRFVPNGDLSFYIFVPAYLISLFWSLWLFSGMTASVKKAPADSPEVQIRKVQA